MNDWIPSQVGLRGHPKTRRLARTLDIPVPHVIGHLHCLWYWALEYAPDGDLEDFELEDIADAAGWTGDAETFVTALVECGSKGRPGFLDRDDAGRLCIHDWEENQGDEFRARIQAAAKKRAQRARRGQDHPPVSDSGDSVPEEGDTVPQTQDTVPDSRDLARAPKTGPDQTGPDRTRTTHARRRTGRLVPAPAPKRWSSSSTSSVPRCRGSGSSPTRGVDVCATCRGAWAT